MHACQLSRFSCVWLFCGPMDCSPPGSSVHGILQQEHWSGLPFPPPGGLPDPGIEAASPALTGGFFTTQPPGEAPLRLTKSTVIRTEGKCKYPWRRIHSDNFSIVWKGRVKVRGTGTVGPKHPEKQARLTGVSRAFLRVSSPLPVILSWGPPEVPGACRCLSHYWDFPALPTTQVTAVTSHFSSRRDTRAESSFF